MAIAPARLSPRCAVFAALWGLVACAAPEPVNPAVPATPPSAIPQPAEPVEPAPAPEPVVAPPSPSGPFLRTLAGTLPLRQDVAPAVLASYRATRRWSSSGSAGRALLEAWEDAADGASRVAALIFDPASASLHTVSIDTGTRRDTMPAVGGTAAGMAMLLWNSQGASNDSLVVGQVLGSAGTSGPRWSYRRGTNPVVGTALAGSTDGYVALWAERRAGVGLAGSTVAQGGQSVLLGQRLTLSGEALGSPTVISSFNARPTSPAIAFGGGGYLAVWSDERQETSRIYARVLDSAGQATSPEILVGEGSEADKPAVAWDGERYQVSWADGRAGQPGAKDYFVQAVTRTGGVEGSNLPVSAFRMTGPAGVSRYVAAGDRVAVFGGRAVDPADGAATAPEAVFGTLLVPGATPSAPFALRAIDGVRLIDAQPWGNGMVVLAEKESGGNATLDWQYLALKPAGFGSYAGVGNQRNGLQR